MEPTSDLIHNNQYSLSIRFSSDGFSLYVYDLSGKLISLKKTPVSLFSAREEETIQLLSEQPELNLNFKKVRIIFDTEKYSVIPSSIYDEKSASDFLYMEHAPDNSETLLTNNVLPWESTVIFAIPVKLRNSIKHFYPTVEIENHISYFLTDIVRMRNENSIQIWVRPKFMDVVVLTNSNIKLINTYTYNTSEDFTYYTLSILEQLSLDPHSCKILLYNSAKKPELQKDILKYAENCETIN